VRSISSAPRDRRPTGGSPSGGRAIFRAALFLALLPLFAFTTCATVSLIDGQPLAAAASLEYARPSWRPFPIGEDGASSGVTDACLSYFSGRVSEPRLEFHALRMSLSSPALRIVARAGGGAQGDGNGALSAKVSSFVRDNGLLAGINALPFEPSSNREGEPRANVGVVVSDGRTLSPPHPRFDALVFFDGGGAAIMPQARMRYAENIANAVGGFFRILKDGEPAPRTLGLRARHPRSAAGVSACGGFLYLLAIDGRRPGSVGATELETALLLRLLGAAQGINFDGGGSTALAMRMPDGEVRVVNAPAHRRLRGGERAVAGVLGIALR